MRWLCYYLRLAVWLGAGLGMSFLAHAQPTLMAEQRQPVRYVTDPGYAQLGTELFSFALPGRRYAHCGTASLSVPNGGYSHLMLSVTKANGDTVRYVRLTINTRWGDDYTSGVVLNPNFTLTYFREHLENNPGATRRDSISLVTLDTLGHIQWRQSHEYPAGYVGHIARVGDGYLLLASPLAFPGTGNVSPKPGLWKFDLRGNSVWQRSVNSRGYGGVGMLRDLILHPDGSYMAVGYTDNGAPYMPGQTTRGRADYLLVKLRPNGDTIWTRRLPLAGQDEYGTRLRLCADGGYALLGYRYRTAGPGIEPGVSAIQEGQALRTDSTGQLRWTQTVSTLPGDYTYPLLQPLVGGDVLFGGAETQVPTVPTYPQALLRRLTPAGVPVYSFQHAVPNYSVVPYSMVNNADGSAYLAGYSGTIVGAGVQQNAYFATFAGVGTPYVPNLCATPPQAGLGAALDPARPGQLLTLDFSAPGPRYAELVAWRWDYGDGTTATGPTPPPHVYALPLPAPGTPVTLTVTNNLGCTATATEYPFGRPTSAQQARALSARATLWPNPTTGAATLEVPGLRGPGPVRLEVCNALGQVLRQQQGQPRQGLLRETLDLAGLPPGVYTVRVFAPEGTLTKRLVKE